MTITITTVMASPAVSCSLTELAPAVAGYRGLVTSSGALKRGSCFTAPWSRLQSLYRSHSRRLVTSSSHKTFRFSAYLFISPTKFILEAFHRHCRNQALLSFCQATPIGWSHVCSQIRLHPLACTSASSGFSPPLSAILVSYRPRPRITTTLRRHQPHGSPSKIIQDMSSRGGKLAPEVNR